ncbi:MAG: DUF502 domain-containing protein [Deltaproteobacteria bacterium]|nr:DUF502 domain-containing protein [Deltaproteobacteria bacterium]
MKKLNGFLKKSFFAGFLVVVPLIGSVWLLWSSILWIDQKVIGFLESFGFPQTWNPSYYLPFDIPGLGILVLFAGLVSIGALARFYFVNYFITQGERVINRIPLFRNIYSAMKQLFSTVFSENQDRFRKVVLVEFPRKGVYALGLITGIAHGELQAKTSQTVYNVFLPTTPNPTSGFFIMFPQDEMTVMDMTVEDAFKVIISGGIVTPPVRASTGVSSISSPSVPS